MTKQIGATLAAIGVFFLTCAILVGQGSITANVVKDAEYISYAQSSSFALFIIFLTTGMIFLFRVRPGQD